MATLPASENEQAPRPGLLGISYPPPARSNLGPYEALAELTRRTGHQYELCHAAFGWFVWDTVVGDAAGEGATREEALEAALEHV
jgi:hypothetical protein